MWKNILVTLIGLILIAGAFWGGYLYGTPKGYQAGYAQGKIDNQKAQEELAKKAAKKATEEAAKAANPFQTSNPLKDVEANPFDKVKKILNPFE